MCRAYSLGLTCWLDTPCQKKSCYEELKCSTFMVWLLRLEFANQARSWNGYKRNVQSSLGRLAISFGKLRNQTYWWVILAVGETILLVLSLVVSANHMVPFIYNIKLGPQILKLPVCCCVQARLMGRYARGLNYAKGSEQRWSRKEKGLVAPSTDHT